MLVRASEGRPVKARGRQRHLTAYLYLLPALMVVAGITYFAVFYNAYISTLDWNGVTPDPENIGMGNYVAIAQDPIFWRSLGNIAVFGVITVAVQMIFGLLLAVVLSGPVFGRGVYKALVFIPVVLAPAAISTAFRQFLKPDGQVNAVLEGLGLGFLQQSWIADPNVALYALAGINIFQWTGFSFLLYQAALSQIDVNSLEAAQIDGAGTLRCFIHVVLPVCQPILGAAVALSFADCWNLVEQPLTYLTTHTELYPLSVVFNQLTQQSTGVEFAGAALYTLPALLIYLYFQNDILEGVQLTELK